MHCPFSVEILASFTTKLLIWPIRGAASPNLSMPPRTPDQHAATADDRPDRQLKEIYSSELT